MSSLLERFQKSSHLGGVNAAYIESLYESWLQAADSVPVYWRDAFQQIHNGADDEALHGAIIEQFKALAENGHYRMAWQESGSAYLDHKQAGVLKMVNAYRVRGHQQAKLDPLGLSKRPQVPDLSLGFHDLDDSDLEREFDTGSLHAPRRMKLRDIVDLLERVYCGSIGSEYTHITDTEQRRWIQARLEGCGGDFRSDEEGRRRILEKLTHAEGLERYLHTKYVGQKRFSVEGAESLIPLLYEAIRHAGEQQVKEVVIGMAHRGRLNVLVNILGKSPAELFEEFEGQAKPGDISRTGDVKYHMGFSSDRKTSHGIMHLALAFNPSHLEIVDPVVVGSARARQQRRDDHDHSQVMPLLIHGDAAIAGQGVVMELFNMSQARGFAVGGTMHVVVNNQIGFTTSNPLDARSTFYCTEVAKMVQAPIFHVNGDDPEAVVFVAKLAEDYRARFRKDVVIDLVCYRRHGHNEADEPAATQPLMYSTIRQLKSTREQFADLLANQGIVSAEESQSMATAYRDALDAGKQVADVLPDLSQSEFSADWTPFMGTDWRTAADTAVSIEKLRQLANVVLPLDEGYEVHSRVKQIIDNRKKMASGELPLDWGFAETMAYAALIDEDYGLRLVGQDSGRGTFFHRHAILHELNTGETALPLARLAKGNRTVTVIDSLLSEEAVLGFEYGYAATDPETLVIWEAQFGDFANGAQVVIDQFISSGEVKWGRLCGLTLFLPHGYEGQGPEHSSARLERFLQLCAQGNMQVCMPTLPAQIFHLLRRQMLRLYRKPLIVMTPKSLLRHKAATSSLEDLATGGFQPVIDDPREHDSSAIKRLVFCSGKVYFDLAAARDEAELDSVAIVRVEQLYPFPQKEIASILHRYSQAANVVWCQEEPLNQGAWRSLQQQLRHCLLDEQKLIYAGRDECASPAVGYYSIHVEEQKTLVREALGLPVHKS
ncbi:MAG: 2-oxoglutarate dehydrogenase E1 component [Wenzhouxiangellaceae bacterium]